MHTYDAIEHLGNFCLGAAMQDSPDFLDELNGLDAADVVAQAECTAFDGGMVAGWDDFEPPCWVSMTMDSYDFITKKSELISVVERRFEHGRNVPFEFRKYVNGGGKERFVMINKSLMEMTKHYKVMVNVTGGDFFMRFCKQMEDAGEIGEDDYFNLIDAISDTGDIYD